MSGSTAKYGLPLERNPNWKGGRTIASNGYVLVKRPDHPDADCRGYVYEHRLVAAEKLGRLLRSGEVVHHIDGDKTNNAPANLQVHRSGNVHRHQHAKRKDIQAPGQANELIECACGCGALITKFDSSGRPRRYVSGHNTQERGRANGRHAH